jgi:hypothetical protein
MPARSRSLKKLVRLLDESAPNVFTVVGLLAVENSPFNEPLYAASQGRSIIFSRS